MSENQILDKMIRRFCTLSVEKNGEMTHPDGRFVIAAGKSARTVSQSIYEEVPFSVDTADVEQQLRDRIAAARQDGHRVIYIRAYQRKGTAYAASERLPDTPDDHQASDDDDGPRKLEASYALVHRDGHAVTLQLIDRLVTHQSDAREREMTLLERYIAAEIRCARLEATLEAHQAGSVAQAAARATEAVAGLLAPAADTLARGLLLYAASRNGVPVDLLGTLRQMMEDVPPAVAGAPAAAPPTSVRSEVEALTRQVASLLQRAPTMGPEDQTLLLGAARQLHQVLGQVVAMADAA